MKRLVGPVAEVIKGLIEDGDTVVEIDGKKYDIFVSLIEEPETTVAEDVEADPELKQKLLQAKKDILEGNYYTSEQMRGMIERDEI